MLLHDPDVVVITETWLHAGITDEEIIPPNYKIMRKDRGSRGGGVALVVKRELECFSLGEVQGNESVFFKVKINCESIIVGAFYRPPNSSIEILEQLYDFLGENVTDGSRVVIAGDFNLPGIQWDTLLPGPVQVRDCEMLLEMAFNFNLDQVVTEITRNGSTGGSVLDLIFLSNNFGTYTVTLHEGMSDHKIVRLETELGKRKHCERLEPKFVPDFSKADDVTILDYLEMAFDNFECCTPVNELWECFKSCVKYCISNYIPYKQIIEKRNNPWVTREILQLQRKLKRKRRKRPVNVAGVSALSSELKERTQVSKTNFFSIKMTSFMKNAPRRFWSYLSPSKPMISQLTIKDEMVVNNYDIATEFNQFFHSVFQCSVSDAGVTLGDRPVLNESVTMEEISISQEGVFALLLELDEKKSGGPDNIPNTFLKRYAEWTSKFLTVIYSASLLQHEIPNDWRRAKVVPIYKAGDRFSVNNYRPISLTCTSCKLLEHILSQRLNIFFENANILFKNQHGFRRKLSTTTQLCECVHDFVSNLNNGDQTDAIFLDLSKAFDRVNHSKLLAKLENYGVDYTLLQWIKAYLSLRTQYVEVNNIHSEDLSVDSGVPQGSVLGPILFLVYINDLVDDLDANVTVRLFADDCLIYTRVREQADQFRLSASLAKIVEWCDHWDMKINSEKSVLLRITNKKSERPFTYTVGLAPLKQVSSLKYLGLIFETHMKWNDHIDKICSAAQRKLGFLRRNFKYATVEAKLVAYKALIRPILEYGCVIWDPYHKKYIERLEKVQRSAARYIMSRYRRTDSVSAMIDDLKLEPLDERRRIIRLKFIFMMSKGCFNIDSTRYLMHNPSHSARLSHDIVFKPYWCKTLQYQKSFFPRTIEEWNHLPEEIVKSIEPKSFENCLRLFFNN